MTDPIDTSPEAIAARIITRLAGARRKVQATIDFTGLAGASKTTLRRLVATCEDAQVEIARLTAERDEARAQVAMAFEAAAKLPTNPEWRWRFEPHWSASDMATAIRALTTADATAALARRDAAMRNEGRRQVKVKPLVWDDFDGQGAKASGFYQANYLVTLWRGRGQFEVSVSYPGYQARFDGEPWHSTMESAKAAAQADYEARILAALEPEGGE